MEKVSNSFKLKSGNLTKMPVMRKRGRKGFGEYLGCMSHHLGINRELIENGERYIL